MNTKLIVDHIQAPLLTAGFLSVQSALSQNAMPDWDVLPAAFVHPVKDTREGESRLGNCRHSQVRVESFAVVVVCAIDDLQGWRDEVDTVLLTPPGPGAEWLPGRKHATQWVEGDIVDLTRTAIWWRDIYSTSVERRFP